MTLRPTRDQFVAHAVESNVIPVALDLQLDLSAAVLMATLGRAAPSAAWQHADGTATVLIEPESIVRARGARFEESAPGLSRTAEVAESWTALQGRVEGFKVAQVEGIDLDEVGGLVGYVSAEGTLAASERPSFRDTPWDFVWMLGGVRVAIDPRYGTARIVVAAMTQGESDAAVVYDRAVEKIRRVLTLLRNPVAVVPKRIEPAEPRRTNGEDGFAAIWTQASEALAAANVDELVLTRRTRGQGRGADALDVFRVVAARVRRDGRGTAMMLRLPEARLVVSTTSDSFTARGGGASYALAELRVALASHDVAGRPREAALALGYAIDPQARGVHRGLVGAIGFDGSARLGRAERVITERGGDFSIAVDGIVTASGEAREASDAIVAECQAALAIARANDDCGLTASKGHSTTPAAHSGGGERGARERSSASAGGPLDEAARVEAEAVPVEEPK